MPSVDFSATFDTVQNWTFSYENHRHGIKETELQSLCVLVSAILQTRGQGLMPATTDDLKNVKNATNWLLSNKEYFTISQFVGILELNSTVASELMDALHTVGAPPKVDELQDRISELEGQLQTFTSEANQISILEGQITKLKNEAYNKSQTKVQPPLSPSHKNIMQQRLRSSSFTATVSGFDGSANNNAAPNPFAPPLVTGSAPSAPPVVDLSSSVAQQLAQLTQVCSMLMNNSMHPPAPPPVIQSVRRPTVSRDPELYSMAKHGTMREYAADTFSMWARDCGMNEEESTLFFAKAFFKPIHKSHVNHIAKKTDGSPKYKTLNPLISQIIQDLKLNQESESDLQNKFNNYKICARVSMDEEFLRCFQYRKIGWPFESEAICLSFCKAKFIYKLHGNSMLHTHLSVRQFLPMWVDATSYHEVTIQLREVENQYKGSVNQSVGSNQPTKMDCNNIACVPCSHVSNISRPVPDQFSVEHVPFQDQQQQVNNVNSVTKTCKNPHCKKPFTPARPKFICCDMDCFRAFRTSEGKPMPAPRKRTFGKKNVNNIPGQPEQAQYVPAHQTNQAPSPAPRLSQAAQHIPGMNNINNANQNVSTTYITPAHLFSTNCKIPFIVRNSLYDTGASPTLITFDAMKDAGLGHLLVPSSGKGTLGGDQTPMLGFRGHIEIKMAVEDSVGYITDSCSKRILVFDKLNHDFIVGQDFMRIGTRHSSLYPTLGKILINPTNKQTKKFNKLVNEQIRSSKNVNNVAIDQFSEDNTFFLNVPCSTFNNVAMERYEGVISLFMEAFMVNAEESFSAQNTKHGPVNQVVSPITPIPPDSQRRI